MIDKENTIAKVETNSNKTKVTYTERGFDFNSLLYDSPEMEKYQSQEDLDRCLEFSSARREFMEMWFMQNKGNISDNLILNALKNHEHKMCYHGLERLEICWSYLLKIGEDKSLLCAGRPCEHKYVEAEAPSSNSVETTL